MGLRTKQFGLIWGLLLVFSSSFSNTIRVPKDFRSIQAGINAAANGDTVLVAAGVYFENINFRGKAIVVKGAAKPEEVIIDGSRAILIDSASTVLFASGESASSILEQLTITGGQGTITRVGNVGGGILCINSTPIIKNCIIKKNSAPAGGGIGFWESSNFPTVTDCVIFDNNAGSYGGGIWVGNSTVSIKNCTLYNNSAGIEGGGLVLTSFSRNSTIVNSIFWKSSLGGPLPFPFLTYCDVQGGFPGEGNINADPLFCEPDSMDFQLAENSSCLGKGKNGENIGARGQGCDAVTVSVNDNNKESTNIVAPHLFVGYPNPFNPETRIKYLIAAPCRVVLNIFDVLGKEKRNLVDQFQLPAEYTIAWDGRDSAGNALPSGVYYYRLEAGTFVQTQKVISLR